MPLITIFTAPKPFTHPHIRIIQRNAIQSWMQLKDVSVILIGEEVGLAETAAEFGLRHLSGIARNEKGTPLVSSVFALARQATDSPLLCYANADMILMPDLITAVKQVMDQLPSFLVVGQRWNLDITEPLDFRHGWEESLRTLAITRGEFYTPWGVDFFVFPREQYKEIPEFAIGRPTWDNWMLYHAHSKGWLTVDVTRSVVAVHQNHDYSHLPGNKPSYGSEEAKWNLALAGGRRRKFNIMDTDRELIKGKIHRPRLSLGRVFRRLERVFVTESMAGYRGQIAIYFGRLALKYGTIPRKNG
jgi:hypothetical protein